MVTAMVFNVVPTALELAIVCGILGYQYGAPFATVTAATMAAYTWFTTSYTNYR
jgi:ABC transporter ATM